jgi:general secretion pathway protein G
VTPGGEHSRVVRARSGRGGAYAFTLIELTIVLVIIATLSSIVVPIYVHQVAAAREEKVITEMRTIEREIARHLATKSELPNSLDEIGLGHLRDPWGRPYEYLRIAFPQEEGGEGKKNERPDGQPRKDHFLVPLNSDYDLYSVGPDGKTTPPLTATDSRDDIVRANDGAYFGPASEF